VNNSKKVALITGITGQDGSYLAELLLEKGYTVHGIVRRTSHLLRSRIEHLRRDEKIYGCRLFLHYGDLSDSPTISRIIADVQPMELYHLAGQSHVGLSFEIPESTCEEAGMATLRLRPGVSRIIWPLCLQWHSLQSRIAAARRKLCHAQDRARRCANCTESG
jgi:GDPmannose 4,6-dehydratase